MATRKGIVKRTSVSEFSHLRKTGLQAITLKEDDELIEVKVTDGTEDLFLMTREGMCIRFRKCCIR